MGSYVDIIKGQLASYIDVQQIINALSARANVPVAVKTTDPIVFSISAYNTDAAARAMVLYAADGATVLFQADATGIKVSPDGTAAVAVGIKNAGHFTAMTIDSGGLVVTAGNVTLTAGELIFAAANAIIVGGPTNTEFFNNAATTVNVTIPDGGGLTVNRGSQTITTGNLTLAGASASVILQGASSAVNHQGTFATNVGVQLNNSGYLYAGSGVPSNAIGNNGDFFFRTDGGAATCVYQRRAGVWVATGA